MSEKGKGRSHEPTLQSDRSRDGEQRTWDTYLFYRGITLLAVMFVKAKLHQVYNNHIIEILPYFLSS